MNKGEYLPQILANRNHSWLLWLFFTFFAGLLIWYLFHFPVVAQDTDFWYHLNGGRFIIENDQLAETSFFSFLDPPRHRADYFWFFRVMVYTIYSSAGYLGIIFFRNILYFIAAAFIVALLLRQIQHPRVRMLACLLITCFLMAILLRFISIRPHMFTYVFILAALYLIEKQKFIWLPLVSLLWVNIHGITYPVMLLIYGAYIAEMFVQRWRSDENLTKKQQHAILLLLGSMLVVYLTPHGHQLLAIPFISTQDAAIYISELRHYPWENFLSWQITNLRLRDASLVNILVIAMVAAYVVGAKAKRVRLAHVILNIGGLVLLFQAMRFYYEFILLSLPLISYSLLQTLDTSCQQTQQPSSSLPKRSSQAFELLGWAVLFLIPWPILHEKLPYYAYNYPFSNQDLPVGVAEFLDKVDTGGKVLNKPTQGGFLQWRIYPKYKIAMDMQVPHLFTDADIFFVGQSYSFPLVMERFINVHNPDYIEASHPDIAIGEFPVIEENYQLVFFDDQSLLYASREKQPEIVAKYAIKAVDLTISLVEVAKLSLAEAKEWLSELQRICAIYPQSIRAQNLLIESALVLKKYQLAQQHSQYLQEVYPKLSAGYYQQGNILFQQQKFAQAVSFLEQAREMTTEQERILSQLGPCYLNLQQYEKAYQLFEQKANIYHNTVTAEQLFYHAVAAFHTQRYSRAFKLFNYANIMTANDAPLKGRILNYMEQFRNL